ncbi:MAG: shikimate dehydrogenase [Desulfomonile sp.]|nr:shikimate dehydrogenase [Desulfomonile sp.]
MVKGTTNVVGVIGWPVAHSLSPSLHNAAFEALGLDWTYVPLPVAPAHLDEAITGLRGIGFRGANVTVPHKERVLPLLDDVSPEALQIGAVNTIVVRDGRLYGDNTDWSGFLDSLADMDFDPATCKALILGSGGSARAIAFALAQRDARITICGRNQSTAASLTECIRSVNSNVEAASRPLQELIASNDGFDLVVNTTPVGMHSGKHDSPWPRDAAMPRCRLVYDLVYNPPSTRLMQQARAQGIRAENGLSMLIYQAARSFSTWTGLPGPVDIMKQVPVPC